MPKHKKMDFFIESHQLREELKELYPKGVYTLDLIRDGKRDATTRSAILGEVGEKVILYNSTKPDCKQILVEITQVEKLNIKTSAEEELWSKKEGWSVEYLQKKPELKNLWQTTFKLLDNNTDVQDSRTIPEPSILLEEYKSCDELMRHIDKMIWQFAAVVFPISLAGLTLFGLSTTYSFERFIITIVVAAGSMALILTWYFLSRQWAGYQNLTFYRMREIEEVLGLWHYRYAIFLKKSSDARKITIEEIDLTDRYRFQKLDVQFGKFPHFGFGRAKKSIAIVFILGWIAIIIREFVYLFLP